MRARDAMTAAPVQIGPDEPLAELERVLLGARLGGVPVVEHGRLLGVVSRSDILRVLGAERALAEAQAEFYHEFHDDPFAPSERAARTASAGLADAAAQVARRMAQLRVRDAMTPEVERVDADAPLRELAARMVARRIHRVLVTEGDRLVGVVSALDLVRLVADGRLA
jgi:CBS domain-containing protein